MAGGFAFSEEKISFDEVKKALNKTVDEMLAGKKLTPSLDIDLELSINDVDVSLVEEISKLEPFGMANPSPAFVVNNLVLKPVSYTHLDVYKRQAMDSLELISSHLSRMRDLAELAANGTSGEGSLQAIQSEINVRSDEINRLVTNTEFNNLNFFEGEPEEMGDFIARVDRLTEDEACLLYTSSPDLENLEQS